ncbi:glycoside hydrolase family 28 protein [Sedimentisphaera salicampi]|uniref:glycoside hydrolase family 28 protein n=1 Tax=Sedimentisphaera salicampi TaxID=1941349 RepID=UPI000B9B8881|nr:glycoside hydrolase family 28 protein [Sedimentisphaera salicampi]OXU14010.1 Exo-poly-alpha-D-galacturonosidase precursor [Sedimentisphaera salicampi]
MKLRELIVISALSVMCSEAFAEEFNAASYGADPTGKTVCTEQIQKTVDACAESGGGTVVFEPGTYLTGSIFLKDNVDLRIDKHVLIKGVQDESEYPDIYARVAGIEMDWPAALINANNVSGIRIYGEGTVDGSGSIWWDKYWNMRRKYEEKGLRWVVDYDCKRPRLMLINESSNVSLEGLTLKEPGFWTVHICYSSNVIVENLTIRANLHNKVGPSSDGIDIDSSNNILVQNCDIDCNDDNFCLKAGRDSDGLRVNRPTYNVVIRDCIARRGAGLITCGSETSGGIYNIEVYNLKAYGTHNGIRFKSAQGRGGTVRDLYIHDIQMQNVKHAIKLDYNWNPAYNTVPEEVRKEIEQKGEKLPAHWEKLMKKVPEKQGTPHIKNIRISNVKGIDCQRAISVRGSEKAPAKKITLKNIDISATKAGKIVNASDWKFKDVEIKADDESQIVFEKCESMSGM